MTASRPPNTGTTHKSSLYRTSGGSLMGERVIDLFIERAVVNARRKFREANSSCYL